MLKPSADGKLPELSLASSPEVQRAAAKTGKSNPILLIGALAFSVLCSVMLLFVEVEEPKTDVNSFEANREKLQEFIHNDTGRLAPYQQYLRESEWALARNDTDTALNRYRKVLNMLYAEGRDQRSLTPSPIKDDELEKILLNLLGSGSSRR